MKNYMWRLTFLCIFGWALTGFLAAQSPVNLTIYTLNGPSGVGMVRLFDNPPQVKGFNIKTEVLADASLMAGLFTSGTAKVGILPPNAAAKIASAGKNIQAAAVLGTGMLSLLSSDPAVQRIEDLRGKTVEVAGQGATPDYVFRRILASKGLKPDTDVKLNYSNATPSIVQLLITGKVSYALLPEPFATMARSGNQNIKLVGNIQDEWIKAGGTGSYPMTVLVVDAAFAASQPAALKAILEAVKASVEWVIANPAEAGPPVEKYLGLKAQVISAAIPRSNYIYIPAAAARTSLESLYRAFLEFDPVSIGGALPKDTFYLK
jgi:NitT/TauT family transport system substrate-binding protein